MGFQFRSEPMALCQLILQTDASFDCLSELGEISMVQFRDLNDNKAIFQRKYINEVRRCEAMERKLKFLMNDIKKRNISVPYINRSPPAANQRALAEYETKLDQLEKEVKGINDSLEILTKNYISLTELKHLLRKTQVFFDQVESRFDSHPFYSATSTSYDVPLISLDDSPSISSGREDRGHLDSITSSRLVPMPTGSDPTGSTTNTFRLRFIAGVIARERLSYFEKMLFRISHGNILLKYSDIDATIPSFNSDTEVHKAVFLIFFQGEQLKNKVLKICEGFHADVYPCPDTQSARREMAVGLMTRLEDINIVLNQTHEHQMEVLTNVAQMIGTWSISIMKAKSIYHMLNKFNVDFTRNSLVGECWCPVKEFDNIQTTLKLGTEKSGMSESSAILHRLPSSEKPPTYNKTNKITKVFQSIIDSYGVSSYMEVNPAIFSIITFPFLFSLMFGDIGHGLLLTLAALPLVLRENSFHPKLLANEVFGMFFSARYMILMQGIFSMYSGLLYNDCFAKPINICGSSWLAGNISDAQLGLNSDMGLDPVKPTHFLGYPYPLGMDPVWQMAGNKITWLNSFKMKISVTFGVLHMLFGVMLGLLNHRFFKNQLNIVCVFVPQLIFLLFTFGYLIILIFHKWIAWDATEANSAPSILIGFINMFLNVYPSEPPSVVVGPAKKALQIFLLSSALICVPWMLLSKPLILRRRMLQRRSYNHSAVTYRSNRSNRSANTNLGEDVRLLSSNSDEDESQFNESAFSVHKEVQYDKMEEPKEFDFADMMINQCIHTIEYCLGCVSHTASYLRLWALSLAHAQLSEVLWKMILQVGLVFGAGGSWGGLLIFIVFTPWAILTLVILLSMEGLSAFLHTLRLHWIEFMSKFFEGGGYPFQPFSLTSVHLEELDND